MFTLRGTAGPDWLVADPFADSWMIGRAGDDALIGQAGNDRLYGNLGDDELQGRGGNDYLDGGLGNDRLIAGDGIDVLHGRQGDDSLIANSLDPFAISLLLGDRGNDSLSDMAAGYVRMEGGTGNDTFSIDCNDRAGQSAEILTGRGTDLVRFDTHDATQFSQTHVRDFTPGQDHIALSAQDAVRTFGTGDLFALLDTDGNGALDGNDPRGDFAFAFKLDGIIEHGIGLFVQGDALVIQLPPGVEQLALSDFS